MRFGPSCIYRLLVPFVLRNTGLVLRNTSAFATAAPRIAIPQRSFNSPNNSNTNILTISMSSDEKKDTAMNDANDNADDDSDAEVGAFLEKLGGSAAAAAVKPGSGWSNGDVQPSMFPLTRNGKLQLYSGTRRWIGLNKGWSRVGADEGDGKETNQYSHRTRRSSQMGSLLGATSSNTKESMHEEAISVRSLIAQLCEQHYQLGWATGTSGGVSIRVGGPSENRPWRVFVAPSGIQKEDMIGDDVFELDMDQTVVTAPKTEGLKLSGCTPIWYAVYNHRPSAKCVIHTHSMNAQMATLLDPSEESKSLKLTHMEMLKGVGGHAFDDILEIPIIDNRPSEDLLQPQMEEALKNYPNVNAVLVRRHGLFVWGDSWEQAKTQAESFDYLFQSAIEMRKLGIDFSAIPPRGTFRTDFESYHSGEPKREATAAAPDEPPSKRTKTTDNDDKNTGAGATVGWNAAGDVDNLDDLKANKTPLLPRDYKYLLLDIEGCTTAISFVKDVLFPYVVEHAESYIDKNLSAEEQATLSTALQGDLTPEQLKEIGPIEGNPAPIIRYMVQNDLKVASLKSFQGKMWKDGYANGTLQGHVYDDFVPMLDWMKSHGVKVYIYSSGSVQAQKLLFGKSTKGDLCHYFSGHFDITTSGNKKQSSSYTNICKDLGIAPSELVFCSDAVAELEAATEAGVGKCIMTVRSGNAPLTKEQAEAHPQVFSLLQLCGSGM